MIIYAIVMLIVLPVAAFAFGLCRAAAKPAPPISRRAAKRRANKAAGRVISQAEFAEGRPMPSQPEPEDEFKRRAR